MYTIVQTSDQTSGLNHLKRKPRHSSFGSSRLPVIGSAILFAPRPLPEQAPYARVISPKRTIQTRVSFGSIHRCQYFRFNLRPLLTCTCTAVCSRPVQRHIESLCGLPQPTLCRRHFGLMVWAVSQALRQVAWIELQQELTAGNRVQHAIGFELRLVCSCSYFLECVAGSPNADPFKPEVILIIPGASRGSG